MIRLTPDQKEEFRNALIDSGDLISEGVLIQGHQSLVNKIAKQYKNEICLNEQYDRSYVPSNGDDIVRFISCPCSKCTPRF